MTLHLQFATRHSNICKHNWKRIFIKLNQYLFSVVSKESQIPQSSDLEGFITQQILTQTKHYY